MRKLVDRGIDWVGAVPENWHFKKGKYLFKQRSERGNTIELQLLSPTQKFGCIPQSLYEELTGANAVKLNEKTDLNLLKTIHRGDFCISLRSFQGGFEYSTYEGVVSPAYQVFYPIHDNVFRGYYKYMFKDGAFIDKMNSFTLSLRDGKNIAFADFGNTLLPIPPIKEQHAIADFLDKKTSEIDAAIKEAQELIDRYNSYKQSVITETVTKGLDPHVTMMDSGVDWIGQIPAHWKVVPFRSYTVERSEKNKGEKTRELLALSYALGVTLYRDKVFNMDRVKDDYEDYQLVYENDLVLSPNDIIKGSVYVSKYFGCISPMYNVFSARNPETHHLPYLSYLLRTKEAGWKFFFIARGLIGGISNTGKYVTRRMTVSRQDLMSFKVLLPSYEEQLAIVDYLDNKCSQIDTIISQKENLISQLQEYKKSIIFEYVTGKKEVPNG